MKTQSLQSLSILGEVHLIPRYESIKYRKKWKGKEMSWKYTPVQIVSIHTSFGSSSSSIISTTKEILVWKILPGIKKVFTMNLTSR